MKKIIAIILLAGSLLLSGCTAVEPNRKYNIEGVPKEQIALIYASTASYLNSLGEKTEKNIGETYIKKIDDNFFKVPGNGMVEIKEGKYSLDVNYEKIENNEISFFKKDRRIEIDVKGGEDYTIGHFQIGENIITACFRNDITPIIKAIRNNSKKEDILNLINKVNDINSADILGRTILMYAAIYNNTEIFKEILKLGADIEKIDNSILIYGESPKNALDYAYDSKVKYMNELKLKNEIEKIEETPFDVIAKEYLKTGKYNKTLGEYVISLEESEKLKDIIELKDVKLKELLEYANKINSKNSIEIIAEKMISKKEELEEVMYYAIQKDNKEMVKKVIKAGKNINEIEVGNEITSLIYAVKLQNLDMIKYLIQLGAKDKVKNDKIKSAVSYAVKYPNIEILKELIKSGGKITEEEIKIVQGKDAELDEMLKDRKNIIKI